MKKRVVGVDHHPDQLLEADLGLPAEDALGLAGVPHQMLYLRRTHQCGIDLHVIVGVQTGVIERDLQALPDRVGLAGGDHVVVCLVLLEHQIHGGHVVTRISPIALGLEVPATLLALA